MVRTKNNEYNLFSIGNLSVLENRYLWNYHNKISQNFGLNVLVILIE